MGLASTGLILLLIHQPRQYPIELLPPPTPGPLEHQDGGRKRKSPNPCETGACIIFDKYSLFIQMELLLLLVGEGSSRDLVDRNYQAQEYTPLHHPCAK